MNKCKMSGDMKLLRPLLWKKSGNAAPLANLGIFELFFVIAVEDRFNQNMNIGKRSLVKENLTWGTLGRQDPISTKKFGLGINSYSCYPHNLVEFDPI